MEEYHGKATHINLNRGFNTVEAQASGVNKDEFAVLQDNARKQQLLT